ncbi:BCS1-like ATPase, putative [Paecilomyces variotii No. 5]|uniref:BCS1-like ATPase, putative n=1 Tax=Byssochlamys spectabilis (strain No. 5 / NBRC 109023) TaxID=1356009 RepID=V5G5H8_BYSSN|nr:BCS1-like ATPase, putative [Paecilomyces variotii No. 5]
MAGPGNVSFNQPQMFPGDASVLDVFIPGYSVVSKFLVAYFHIDLSFYLPLIALFAASATALRYSVSPLVDLFTQYYTSTAEIRLNDEIYNFVMAWIAQQSFSDNTRAFVAGTRTSSEMVWSRHDDDDDEDGFMDDDDDGAFDFDEYWARKMSRDKYKPLRFTPADGTHYFWYKGRLLSFKREKDENNGSRWIANAEKLYITCLGRDPTIIKDLLHEAQHSFVERDANQTIIYRGQKNLGESADWVRCMSRPPRPLSTVVLDQAQKQAFIEDVKEYLHPVTRRWYSNRGIPYRRGYIFHGPPGTGKTSLCFAAAGLLGLKMYLVNLNSKSLDEEGLADLFQNLPRRCIVLLEDVDSAGITHKRDQTPEASDTTVNAKPDNDGKEKPSAESNDNAPRGISLSALLNVIDGVASSEGRILVMTTNHIEKLDAALLRPGRVDMSIAFNYSDTATIRDLYFAIYGDETQKQQRAKCRSPKSSLKEKPKSHIRHGLSNERVKQLAAEFASVVPSGEFSPAEIQGYLLIHKHEPEKAVQTAAEWVQSVRSDHEKRRAGSKEDAN